MSYDLYLFPKAFDADAIRSWFAGRGRYEVSETQAAYGNADTGVYFMFDISEDAGGSEEVDEDAGGKAVPHVAFNLNYFRAHVFALEAEPEVAAFVQRFDCRISDPQTDGMGEGPYSSQKFFAGWTRGNRFAFQVMGGGSDGPYAADPELIEAAWDWNYQRAALQRSLGDNIFVPKVCWAKPNDSDTPLACVTWTWGVPTIIPDALVTHVVLVRQQKPSLLGLFSKSSGQGKPELLLQDVSAGIKLRGVERQVMGEHSVLVTPATGPLEVQALFSGNWPKPQFTIVPPDKVCGADLVALSRKA